MHHKRLVTEAQPRRAEVLALGLRAFPALNSWAILLADSDSAIEIFRRELCVARDVPPCGMGEVGSPRGNKAVHEAWHGQDVVDALCGWRRRSALAGSV